MPQVVKSLGDTYETVTRPAVFGVIKDTLKAMGWDDNAYLSFKGFSEAPLSKDSTLDAPVNRNYFGSDTMATISVTEGPRREMLYTNSVLRPDQLTVFRDTTSNIYLRPITEMTECTIEFELRFNSKVDAMRWRDNIHSRSRRLHHQQYHSLVYSYSIPPVVMEFLYDMHGHIKGNDLDEEQDFADWFFKYADKRTTTLTNVAGSAFQVVIPETQKRVLGFWTFGETVDKPEYDKEKNTWTITWEYTFIYDKPIEMAIYHELIVRQQVIDQKYWPVQPEDVVGLEDLAMSNSNALAEHHLPYFEARPSIYTNRQPIEDTWLPLGAMKTDMRHYTPLFVSLVALPEAEEHVVINLDELGEFTLSNAARSLIYSDRENVTKLHESVMHVCIFSGDHMAFPEQQTLGDDMILRATIPLSRKPVYRVVISMINDFSRLSDDAQERTRNNACVVKELLSETARAADEVGLIPIPSTSCRWDSDQWGYIIDLLRPPGVTAPWKWDWPPRVNGVFPHPDYRPPGHPADAIRHIMRTLRTVGIFGLIAKRKVS